MRVYFVTMPYKDPEKRREFERRWRDKNRERVNAQRRKRWRERNGVRDLRVVLTPLTSAECRVYIDRLQRRKAATRDVECKACAERVREREEAKRRKRERAREWKKANPEKVREHKRKWREKNREKLREQKQANREKAREPQRKRRQPNPEKVRERQRKWRQAHPEKVREHERKRRQAHREKLRERKQRWRENNPEKVKAQRERERERKKARLEGDEERMRVAREKVRERKRRYPEANREKLREQKRRWRRANPEKVKAQRERSREADNARARQYYEARGEECNRARRQRYARQKARSVPPLPCDCGACLACGGWGASWKPAWHARLNAFSVKKDPLPASLEELPLDLLESEAETLSIASTSEIDSELGDRLDALLADESDSEVETVDKVEAPTRRSDRIATMPAVSYQDWEEEENPMLEFLKRKAQLHAEGEDRIVTRWELLEHRTERVDAIVEEMSTGVDPRRELDRFHSQLERQDCVLNVMVSEALLDFVDGHL